MFQDRLLGYRHLETQTRSTGEVLERIVPDWLSSRDEVWLGVLAQELDGLAGQTVIAADERVRAAVIPVARRHGAGAKQAMGVWSMERRRWKARVASPIAPERIREVLFGARVGRARGDALTEASRVLGIEPSILEACLFADRRGARILVPPPDVASPSNLVERYNMTLAQAFLMRSRRVVALVRAHARSVVRYAKLTGLMATFEGRDDGTLMTFSGPLSLFHETTKYGRALAGILPSLAATPDWALRADVVLRGERFSLELDASAPLPLLHALPKPTDSAVERRLVNDVRRLRSGWELAREDTVVRVGQRLFFPDFTLRAPDDRGRVLLEVVGYWDPAYLANKIEALAAVDTPIVVCVDERHASGWLSSGPNVLSYRAGRIDVVALMAAAERALDRAGASVAQPPSRAGRVDLSEFAG
jgi:predicted nuclease of restriction endonuclease-like RecB superfamily